MRQRRDRSGLYAIAAPILDGDNRFLKPLEAQLHEVTIALD
jgi:hypothetical protein